MAQFAEAGQLHRYAQCWDMRRVPQYQIPPSVQAHYEWDEPVCEPCEIEPVVEHVLQQTCDQLQGRVARSVTVAAHTTGGWKRGCRLLREGTASWQLLRLATQRALESAWRPGVAVRGVEVRLDGLALPQAVQGHLFGAVRPGQQAAVQAMRERFPGALLRAVIINANAYLPEEAFRLEPISDERIIATGKSAKLRPVRSPRRRKEGRPKQSSPKRPASGTDHAMLPRHNCEQNCKSPHVLLPGFDATTFPEAAAFDAAAFDATAFEATVFKSAGR
jgi:hypothetical protein